MNDIPISAAEQPVTPEGMMVNAHGYYMPISRIRPETLLEDQLVKMLCGRALELQALLASFREAAFNDADAQMGILAEKYGAKPRSTGNTTLVSFDGLLRVEISTGHFITLGAELAAAKALIDECLTEWTSGADDSLKAIVNDAFAVGDGQKLRVDRILALRRVEIADPRWRRAMEAISDAVRITRSKRYIRFHQRATADAPWQQIVLDAARVA